MSATKLAAVTDQVQKFWSPRFTKELRASHLLGSLVNREYRGEIKKGGDTVTVSQIVAASGELLNAQTDDSFSSEALQVSEVSVTADKRAVASYKFNDIVDIQSLIEKDNPEVMESLMYGMNNQINNYLYSLVSPSTSAPDHDIASVTDFNSTQLSAVRTLAAQAKWRKAPGWYLLLDPQYYSDLLNSTNIVSSDFSAGDAPVVGGVIGTKRFGFSIFEDDSRSADFGLAFHPDFLLMVQQTEVQVKISDLHALGQFGYLMSVDLIFGAKLGIDGAKKHIKIYNT